MFTERKLSPRPKPSSSIEFVNAEAAASILVPLSSVYVTLIAIKSLSDGNLYVRRTAPGKLS